MPMTFQLARNQVVRCGCEREMRLLPSAGKGDITQTKRLIARGYLSSANRLLLSQSQKASDSHGDACRPPWLVYAMRAPRPTADSLIQEQAALLFNLRG